MVTLKSFRNVKVGGKWYNETAKRMVNFVVVEVQLEHTVWVAAEQIEARS